MINSPVYAAWVRLFCIFSVAAALNSAIASADPPTIGIPTDDAFTKHDLAFTLTSAPNSVFVDWSATSAGKLTVEPTSRTQSPTPTATFTFPSDGEWLVEAQIVNTSKKTVTTVTRVYQVYDEGSLADLDDTEAVDQAKKLFNETITLQSSLIECSKAIQTRQLAANQKKGKAETARNESKLRLKKLTPTSSSLARVSKAKKDLAIAEATLKAAEADVEFWRAIEQSIDTAITIAEQSHNGAKEVSSASTVTKTERLNLLKSRDAFARAKVQLSEIESLVDSNHSAITVVIDSSESPLEKAQAKEADENQPKPQDTPDQKVEFASFQTTAQKAALGGLGIGLYPGVEDQTFLESVKQVAGLFEERGKLPEPAKKNRAKFLEDTWTEFTSRLARIHPEWAARKLRGENPSRGEMAWEDFKTRIRNEMNKKVKTLKEQGKINEFSYTKIFTNVSAGLNAANKEQAKTIEDLVAGRLAEYAAQQLGNGSTADRGDNRRPRCFLRRRLR